MIVVEKEPTAGKSRSISTAYARLRGDVGKFALTFISPQRVGGSCFFVTYPSGAIYNLFVGM